MKKFTCISIFLMFVIISVSVLAVNDDVEREVAFDPNNPHAGKYRVAAEYDPFKTAHCYTHAKAVRVDPPIYPSVRISYYATGWVTSHSFFNRGEYETYAEIPTRSHKIFPVRYAGEFSAGSTVDRERDYWRGVPDVDDCNAHAKISDSGFAVEAKIPFP